MKKLDKGKTLQITMDYQEAELLLIALMDFLKQEHDAGPIDELFDILDEYTNT